MLTSKDLKAKLWNTIVALEKGEMDVRRANAIVASAREIINTVREEITLVKLSGVGGKPSTLSISQDGA